MRIGHITLANRLFAAPMAGVTDRPFRMLCKKLGAGYAVSEMVTSRRELWNSLKTSRRADHRGESDPIAVQIAGTDAALIVNITNDAWFGDTAEPWEHLALATIRSIEHRRYLVRSTNSGVSAFVDPVGRVMSHTSTFKSETLDETVHLMKGATVYEYVGDKPWWVLAAATVFLAFRRRPGTPTQAVEAKPKPKSKGKKADSESTPS